MVDTTKNDDIRWKQRFSNFKKAFGQLTRFIEKKNLSDLEKQGLIKSFEYTYELGWNTLKDYLEFQGNTEITGSRDAIRNSFKAGLISDGEVWIDMMQSRNRTSHVYNDETAEEIAKAIISQYYDAFVLFKERFDGLIKKY